MVKPPVGKGSQYVIGLRDSDGGILNGSETYKLHIPANVPAKRFWELTVYDNQTRNPVLKIQIIARAEMALLQIRAQRVAGRSTLFIVAMVFALLALAMLNFAAFHAIAPGQGPALAALFVALIDIGAAVIMVAAARKAGPTESQERLAREIRELAYTELNRDIELVQSEVQETVAEVRQLRSSVESIGALVGLVGKLTSGD